MCLCPCVHARARVCVCVVTGYELGRESDSASIHNEPAAVLWPERERERKEGQVIVQICTFQNQTYNTRILFPIPMGGANKPLMAEPVRSLSSETDLCWHSSE